MRGWEWRHVAEFLLMYTVNFVESELVETNDDMKRFDLMIRILGEDGRVNSEGITRIADAFMKLGQQMGKFIQRQDDIDADLEARNGMMGANSRAYGQEGFLQVRKAASTSASLSSHVGGEWNADKGEAAGCGAEGRGDRGEGSVGGTEEVAGKR